MKIETYRTSLTDRTGHFETQHPEVLDPRSVSIHDLAGHGEGRIGEAANKTGAEPTAGSHPTRIAVIDTYSANQNSVSHGQLTSSVAENASSSGAKNVLRIPTDGNSQEVVNLLRAIASHPGDIKVVNLSIATAPSTIYRELKLQHPDWTEPQLVSEAQRQFKERKKEFGQQIDQVLERLNKQGVSVVVAAGNDGETKPGVPVPKGFYDNWLAGTYEHKNVIVVGASDSNSSGAHAVAFSSPGRSVDVAADGEGISVGNLRIDGTSFSSPQIAGLVADLYAVNPSLTPSDVKNILKLSTYRGTSNAQTGAGIVDRARAILLAMPAGSQTRIPLSTPYFNSPIG